MKGNFKNLFNIADNMAVAVSREEGSSARPAFLCASSVNACDSYG